MHAWNIGSVSSHKRLFIAFAVVLLMANTAAAQRDSGSPTNASAPDRGGLVIHLAKSPDEAVDSDAKKTCLADHPPASCELLTVTLKNEGSQAILSWHTTCQVGIGFDVATADGWKPFPSGTSVGEIPICARNVLFVRRLLPGQSYVQHLRLADPSLGLNTTAPPSDDDGALHVRGKGYALLMGNEPLVIRARWHMNNVCLASDAVKSDSDLNPFAGRLLCARGMDPHPTILTSEALRLR